MLFILSYFFGPGETMQVKVQAPSKVRPGDSFVYQLTLNKGNLNGFGRIQVFIPQGFSVSPLELKNSQFLFEEDYVKFIWVQLPDESEFTVSMKIQVDAAAEGEKYLNGEVSFIKDDKTEKLALDQATILLDPTLPQESADSKPEIERRLIALAPEKGEYQVELMIHPNKENGAARFIDDIPEGYVASVVDAHGAEFSFTDQSAIFSWKALPTESSFSIVYKVSAGENKPSPNINGMLVYGDQMLTSNSGVAMMQDTTNKQPADIIVESLVESENNRTLAAAETKNAIPDLILPAPQSGIYYKVQISATRKSPERDNTWFSTKYKWQNSVDLTMHEGWKKYLIGNFKNYTEAKAFCNQTSAQVSDAFVVAYDQGQRISVQEALKAKNENQ